MEIIKRDDLVKNPLPGRTIQNAVGKKYIIDSSKMTVGFATYSAESGIMEPHHHAEESIYVIDAKKAYVLHGDSKENLGDRHDLEKGMVMHFPEDEWHVFLYDDGGYLDIIFIYGEADNLRPEKIGGNKS